MQVTVNGEEQVLAEALSVAELVEQLGLAQRRIAIEINGEIVPRSHHPDHRLQPGDKVEVVHAIGGGQPGQVS